MADSKQFEKLAMQYMDQLYSTARYWTGSETDAADLVQETYLRAFKGFDSFQEGTNLRAWLYRIMKNTHLNIIRKESKQIKTVEVEDENLQSYSSSFYTQSDNPSFVDNLTSQEVEDALAELPQEYKEALLLIELEGFTYKEAADILDVPIGTVMSRISRARKKLGDVLYEYASQSKLLSK